MPCEDGIKLVLYKTVWRNKNLNKALGKLQSIVKARKPANLEGRPIEQSQEALFAGLHYGVMPLHTKHTERV